MLFFKHRRSLKTLGVLALAAAALVFWTTRSGSLEAAPTPNADTATFEHFVKPFFDQNCMMCHNTDIGDCRHPRRSAGRLVRRSPDSLLGSDSHENRRWHHAAPGHAAPTAAERKQMVDWITQNIEAARVRQAPKNGIVAPAHRRAVSQYSAATCCSSMTTSPPAFRLTPSRAMASSITRNAAPLHAAS